jgi:hypothetical protein
MLKQDYQKKIEIVRDLLIKNKAQALLILSKANKT